MTSCLTELDQITQSETLHAFRDEISPVLWTDELGRLRVWVANTGAHKTGGLSLEARLRNMPDLREQVVRLLNRMRRGINDLRGALKIPNREKIASDENSESSDDENQGKTELQLIYHDFCDTINELFRVAILIQQARQHEKILEMKELAPIVKQEKSLTPRTYQSDTRNQVNRSSSHTEDASNTRISFQDHLSPGRTAWSATVAVKGRNIHARYWYDGQYINNAKEDAADVALRVLHEETVPKTTLPGQLFLGDQNLIGQRPPGGGF
ncbi:hypothetical protein N7540_005420 [Penicillium herquei]|nr:hypothetical protein N7540_005420 [Penicillium herquei]